MFKNWKTTLFGILLGASGAASSLAQAPGSLGRYSGIVSAISGLLLGLFAKDRNVTGAGPSAEAK